MTSAIFIPRIFSGGRVGVQSRTCFNHFVEVGPGSIQQYTALFDDPCVSCEAEMAVSTGTILWPVVKVRLLPLMSSSRPSQPRGLASYWPRHGKKLNSTAVLLNPPSYRNPPPPPARALLFPSYSRWKPHQFPPPVCLKRTRPRW